MPVSDNSRMLFSYCNLELVIQTNNKQKIDYFLKKQSLDDDQGLKYKCKRRHDHL